MEAASCATAAAGEQSSLLTLSAALECVYTESVYTEGVHRTCVHRECLHRKCVHRNCAQKVSAHDIGGVMCWVENWKQN